MVELTQKQKFKLKNIVGDKFSVGAFCGMITNLHFQHSEFDTDTLIQKALEVRLRVEELCETEVPVVPTIPIHKGNN